MFKNIIENIKEYFATKRAKKALTLLIMNQYSDLLIAEKETKEAEKEAYESMKVFGDAFSVEDFQNLLGSVNRIADNPELTNDYFKQVSAQAHAERTDKLEVTKK